MMGSNKRIFAPPINMSLVLVSGGKWTCEALCYQAEDVFARVPVQGFTVVDKSDFCPSRLTVHSDTPYDQEALHVSYFKRRGSLWLYTFSCFCSCSSLSSLSRCFVAFLGLIFSF